MWGGFFWQEEEGQVGDGGRGAGILVSHADGHLVTGEMLPTFQVGKKGYRLNKDKLAENVQHSI